MPLSRQPAPVAEAISTGLHSLAQPLTILQGVLELALSKAETVEEYRNAVEVALGNARRAIGSLNDVRESARQSWGPRRH
jgi:hypothetical protein